MREATLEPLRWNGGWALMGPGALALALALALVVFAGSDQARIANDDGAAGGVEGSSVEQAAAFWEARVASDPADFIGYNRLANAYIQRARGTGDVTDYARAQTAVDASLAELPGDNAPAYATLAALQNVRHEFASAEKSARKSLALDASDTGALGSLGDAQLALGRYDEALATYNDLVAQAPGLASFSRLAHILEIRGESAEAETAWENAFSVDSGRSPEATAWARVQFGNFHFDRGDVTRAGREYDVAFEVLPGYLHGLAAEARLAAVRGEYGQAIDVLVAVTERQPLPEYVTLLGDVYLRAGDEAEAQRQYALVEAIAELYAANGIDTDLQMALFFADHDIRVEDALRSALAVHEQQPDSIYAADAAAWAMLKAGRPEEALPYMEQALRLGTPDANLWFHAGMVYAATGDDIAAREALEQALAVNPDFSLLSAPIAETTLEALRG